MFQAENEASKLEQSKHMFRVEELQKKQRRCSPVYEKTHLRPLLGSLKWEQGTTLIGKQCHQVEIQPENQTVSFLCSNARVPVAQLVRTSYCYRHSGLNPGWISMSFFFRLIPAVIFAHRLAEEMKELDSQISVSSQKSGSHEEWNEPEHSILCIPDHVWKPATKFKCIALLKFVAHSCKFAANFEFGLTYITSTVKTG